MPGKAAGSSSPIGAVVTDIEGTTSSILHVHRVLFPYSRDRVADWLWTAGPEHMPLIDDVRKLAGLPRASLDKVAEILRNWIDADRKASPLKEIQGLIWADGYQSGEISSHVYADVPRALRRWRASGLTVGSYSSGSILAQQLWFRHTPVGDLLPYFDRFFDIPAVGPKHERDSYQKITAAIGLPGEAVLFMSDVRAELDAAAAAGLRTVGVHRVPGDRPGLGDHPVIDTFDRLKESSWAHLFPEHGLPKSG
ncbi:acireductone synthase [Actinomadura pelletieri]|uniref:acireductone synthase n=1 Tax=Actinomadura pelletieri TaxID=111805 RepID=UPI001B8621E5|nr:acireductone synthase [Actinomadura pelletieri]